MSIALFLFFFSTLFSNPCDTTDLKFVSIGSYCAVAEMLRTMGLRQQAFPFDWITSINDEKMIEVLDEDFAKLFHRECYTVNREGMVSHGGYVLTFPHEEWVQSGKTFEEVFVALRDKYQRRIERFRNIRNFRGKVYFIRAAYPDFASPCKNYYEISDSAAWRMYWALERFFPEVDFSLIVVNIEKQGCLFEKNILSDRLLMIGDQSFRSFLDAIASSRF